MWRILALASFALASPLVLADVAVYGTPGSHATLQSAVDAASSGDVLVVAPGTYPGFTIDGKSLTVLAVPGEAVRIEGTIVVRGTRPNQRVLLVGLTVTGTPATEFVDPGRPALWLDGVEGHVRVRDAALTGGEGYPEFADGGPHPSAGPGVLLSDARSVVFSGCEIRGGRGGGVPGGCFCTCNGNHGGHGIESTGSRVAVYACSVLGGKGGDCGNTGGHGGDGVHAATGSLFAAASEFIGGDGGGAYDALAFRSGDGGDALDLSSPFTLHLVDSLTVPGEGGPNDVGEIGDDGVHTRADAGVTILRTSGKARLLESPAVAVAPGVLPVLASGEPGDFVQMDLSLGCFFQPLPPLVGVALVPLPMALPVQGGDVIGGTGSVAIDVPIPAQATVERVLYGQALVATSLGSRLSGPLHAVLLRRDTGIDCDGNGTDDRLDLIEGSHSDCDANLVPDVCQLPAFDCNANGTVDTCDIDAGTSLDQNHDGIPDECQPSSTWFVDDDAPAGGDGSAAAPFQTLRAAFDASISGDAIRVHDGLYTGPDNREIDFESRDLDVRSLGGPAGCVIDCELLGGAFVVSSGVNEATRVEGFTFRRGRRTGSHVSVRDGSALQIVSKATIAECVFEQCVSTFGAFGGAVSARESGRIEDCTFTGNHAGSGGALLLRNGSVAVRCRFENNTADEEGGAVYAAQFHGDVEPLTALLHCTLIGNSADSGGGALRASSGTVIVDNCLFASNSTIPGNGGAIKARSVDSLTITNSTLVANRGRFWGGGIADARNTTIANSILWGNAADTKNGSQLHVGGDRVSVRFSDVDGGLAAVSNGGFGLEWGPGNLDVDPAFADPDGPDDDPSTLADNDYRLGALSPCLDAGQNGWIQLDWADVDGDGVTDERVPHDLDGGPRRVDDPAPDTGAGAAPIVDMGAWERD